VCMTQFHDLIVYFSAISNASKSAIIRVFSQTSNLILRYIKFMFGKRSDEIFNTMERDTQRSPETLKLIEDVLDYIRSNLSNIRRTWGSESPQYKSATTIMNKYLEENFKRLNVQKPDLEELMSKMSIEDPKS